MGAILLLVIFAAPFAATGLLVVGAKWLLVVATVVAVSIMFTLRYGRRLSS